jgi:16S rRNA (cytosine967-C5)-methyltransferase
LDLAFDEAARDLPDRERRWLHEAAYGTIRLRGRIDHLFDLHLRKGLKSLSPTVLDLFRLGAYQLLYMESVPSYAALSQTVAQVRSVAGEGGARLANGVLRSLDGEGADEARFPAFEEDPEGYLRTWGSHPGWMVRRWLERWGPDDVRRLVEWNNVPPPSYFRPLGVPLDEALSILLAQDISVSHVEGDVPCLQVMDGTNPARILETTPGIMQDPGAALVTEYGDFPSRGWVVDACAAPGGKALAVASRGAYVLAADRSIPRLRLVKDNLDRVGGRMDLVAALAQAPPFKEVPALLLDVPCSGTGTLRRHPDSRWRLEAETVDRLAGVQGTILDAWAERVAVGGVLVYSTCSLEAEENQLQVEAFLRRHRGYRVEITDANPRAFVTDEGYLVVTPQDSGFDGAFAARLVRIS